MYLLNFKIRTNNFSDIKIFMLRIKTHKNIQIIYNIQFAIYYILTIFIK